MMVGGIVMVSLAPLALIVAAAAAGQKSTCELADGIYTGSGYVSGTQCDDRYDPTIYGGLISAVVLAGVGIPLIVIGSRREPIRAAVVQPWATPEGGGLRLRLAL
jgi:hypothetical protein